MQIDASETCHVCSKEVGVAHRCRNCKQFVHLICGHPLEEEGYGQDVICFSCKDKGKYFDKYYHQSRIQGCQPFGGAGGPLSRIRFQLNYKQF